jgi:hypothetical protein
MRKAEALTHWRSLDNQAPLKPESIPYKHRGTTYGADGVRIEGTQQFVDAVLARLTDLLAFENNTTRLGLAYNQVEPRDGKPNDYVGNYVCYVKVHERGGEAQMVNTMFNAYR